MKKTSVYGLLGLTIVAGIGLAGWTYNQEKADPNPSGSTGDTSLAGESEKTFTGKYVSGGVECQLFQGDDGQTYTLVGSAVTNFEDGDSVRLEASVADASFCMQGTTLVVSKIEKI